ncbi:Pyoverdine/dityrosine biosynthesis protein-domain-containing protein [Hypoxylon fragiforme]|uniref:Pyoverdine/dityrosine biosynthesis protein-domain-containing protein n=1 Tax=Hypoxylon fragiforme TaxID=63214 RepID=UPI0020C73C2E|nr:Pyoverdine/dityrosine biosynthesis protein-domain-containing protein [Hypoxylon fragiforme]KAI2604453.1 Pyoverdine/dityrosine biosynthesis protein-domain-containing protein [Hypoxylon fragiforme]
MEFPHEGASIYYRHQAAFARDLNGKLLYCIGPQESKVRENWHLINIPLVARNHAATKLGRIDCVQLGDELQGLTLYEVRHFSNGLVTGMILDEALGSCPLERDFEAFFCHLILHQASFGITISQLKVNHAWAHEKAVEKIVSLFDTYLRYQGENDKWAESGRAYFTDRVTHFTSQARQIELCLPAFPCKSSNFDKVAGKDPDRGEQLALERLHNFVAAIEKIYQPGAKLWIISDGHVFSDCIGVNDHDVDVYGRKLIEMNRAIGIRLGNPDRVGFKSLVDLFELEKYRSQADLCQIPGRFKIPVIDHHVQTLVTLEAEISRRILMAGCPSQRVPLRERIESQDPAILALYRGFSRFMLEDLEHHPFTRNMTRSKQKKLSSKVAFEMIMRNQAYSNLVELLFPNHIRLSIHAHNNAGPKFGIQLFDPTSVRTVESLSPNGRLMTSRDLLHIPTPWHNCVVSVAGSKVLYVTKAKVVREALAEGSLLGGLIGEVDAGGVQDTSRVDNHGAVYFSVCHALDLDDAEADGRKICEDEEKQQLKAEMQKVVVYKEGIAGMLTGKYLLLRLKISPIVNLATGTAALACDADYVFV